MRLLALAAAALALGGPVAKPTLQVHASRFGPILFDGRQFVLYAFTKDGRGRSRCTGACAAAWPPYIVRSASAVAGKGTKRSLYGTVRRADGRLQVTYARRPLYYYVGDREPLQILCQDVVEFGGRWLVVRGDGGLVR
jgi:predicted lipoprotein with Yx(FWY)xxD motif